MLPIYTTGQVQNGITPGGDLMLDLSDYMKKKDAEKLATTEALEALSNIVSGKLDSSPQHKHHIEDVKQIEEALNSKYDKSEKYSHNVILNDIEKISYLEAPKIELMEIVKDKDGSGYKFYVDDSNGDLMITLDDVLIGSYFKATGKWYFNGMGSEVSDISQQFSAHLANSEQRLKQFTNDISLLRTDVDSCFNSFNDAMMQIVMLNQANIKTQNSLDGHITEASTKINTVESIINEYISKTDAVLKNHYDALLILCQKHGMVDSNTGDSDKITPQ